MNWNSTIQYQFAASWLLDLSYQRSAGVRLWNSWNINVTRPDITTDRAELDRIFQNPQAYRPFTQFGKINYWSNFGHSTYHSGTIRVEKRSARGLAMTAFYTWSKAINDADNDGGASGVTYYNRSLEKARASYDLPHRFISYLTYDLPLGKGRKWIQRGALEYLLGGWQISFIQTLQSGTPFSFGLAGSPSRYFPDVTMRPHVLAPYEEIAVKDWNIGERFDNNRKNPMWNIDAFAYPEAYTLGTAGRNILLGPPMNWSQGMATKTLSFGERFKLDLRLEANNIFKTVTYDTPNSTVNLTNPGLFGKPTTEVQNIYCPGARYSAAIGGKFWF